MQSLLVLALVGLAAQLVDGSLGMAYGVTSSTLLVAVGITPAMASGSVHLAEVGTTLLSGISHWRFGNIDWRIVARLGVPGALGAFLGATALSNLSSTVARPWMAAILAILGALLLVRFSGRRALPSPDGRTLRARFLSPLGLIAGFVDASGGGGWGPIATPTMLVTGRVELHKVIGSVSASEFLVAFAASTGFLISLSAEGLNWAIAGALLAGGAVAAPLAAWLVRKVAPRIIGAGVGGLITVLNVNILLGNSNLDHELQRAVLLLVASLSVIAMVVAVRRHRTERADGPRVRVKA